MDTEFTEENSERDGDVYRVRGVLYAFDYVLRGGCVDEQRDGSLVSILRHLEWMFTTPILIVLAYQLQAVSFPENGQKRKAMYFSVVLDEFMLMFGILCHFVSGNMWWLSLSLAILCFISVMYNMGYLFYELTTKLEHEDDRLRFYARSCAVDMLELFPCGVFSERV